MSHKHRFAITDWAVSKPVYTATLECDCGETREGYRTTTERDEFEKQVAAFNVEGEPDA